MIQPGDYNQNKQETKYRNNNSCCRNNCCRFLDIYNKSHKIRVFIYDINSWWIAVKPAQPKVNSSNHISLSAVQNSVLFNTIYTIILTNECASFMEKQAVSRYQGTANCLVAQYTQIQLMQLAAQYHLQSSFQVNIELLQNLSSVIVLRLCGFYFAKRSIIG